MNDTAISRRTVGFIGAGMMGRGMARHVLAAGHPVALLLRSEASAAQCAELLAGGAQGFKSAAEVAAVSDVLIVCVTGSPQVEEVVFGDDGILSSLKPGCLVVDCSTSRPDSTLRVAQTIEARQGRFLDAALTGTPKHAQDGQLNLLVGGDPAVLDSVRPVFDLFAQNVFYCGGVSAGHATKLLHQFVVLGNAAILAEAFACAGKADVDLSVLCDVIASGGANSTAFQRLRPFVLEGDDQMFRFSLANALKDMDYYARMTSETKAVSFLGDTVHNVYTLAGNLGFGPRFIPHLLRGFEALNGKPPSRD